MNPTKTILRRELRSRRSDLSDALRARHDKAIGQQVSQLICSPGAKRVACYRSFNREPDITAVYKQLMGDGHELALVIMTGVSKHYATRLHP